MTFRDRVGRFLSTMFTNVVSPEWPVQDAMEKQGWTFRHDPVSCGEGAALWLSVMAPDGTPAVGWGQTEQSLKLYGETVRATCERLGLTPR